MLLINDPGDAPHGPKVLAIGSFDGLHLGHQHLIARAKLEAQSQHLPLLLYTFDPPSKVFMRGEGFLSDLSEKLELLPALGVDIALIVSFNTEFSRRSKDEFLSDLKLLQALCIYVGEDFRFGQGRAGGLEDLKTIAPTIVLPLIEHAGGPVKSSRIRELLRGGLVDQAADLLGRPYTARGIVVEGNKLGRTLGFPTANVQVAELKLLPMGVYAVQVRLENQMHGGVANIGYRPTVDGRELRCEVFVFDFDGDLYGKELTLYFAAKVRDEMRFANLEALKAQIAMDAAKARELLATLV
jgi:riboflavin kinase/FMN adenylyltransferase